MKFSFDKDRSSGSIPSVTVSFQDGFTDTLKLRQYFTNDNEKSDFEANTCAYIGYLEKDPKACVAMTGCYGEEDVEFSILSKHAVGSGMYKWTQNGDVQIINHPLSSSRVGLQNIHVEMRLLMICSF